MNTETRERWMIGVLMRLALACLLATALISSAAPLFGGDWAVAAMIAGLLISLPICLGALAVYAFAFADASWREPAGWSLYAVFGLLIAVPAAVPGALFLIIPTLLAWTPGLLIGSLIPPALALLHRRRARPDGL